MAAVQSWIRLRTGWSERFISILKSLTLVASGVILAGGLVEPLIFSSLLQIASLLVFALLVTALWSVVGAWIETKRISTGNCLKVLKKAWGAYPPHFRRFAGELMFMFTAILFLLCLLLAVVSLVNVST